VVKLSKFEMELMDELWRLGTAAVREILEVLPEKKRPAYTTVQTMMRRLEEKGAVKRVRKIGNAYIFEPTITKRDAQRRLISDLLAVLGGSRPLMAHLAESGEISLEDIHELEAMLENRTE
jgi:predicted transcriptional regulator